MRSFLGEEQFSVHSFLLFNTQRNNNACSLKRRFHLQSGNVSAAAGCAANIFLLQSLRPPAQRRPSEGSNMLVTNSGGCELCSQMMHRMKRDSLDSPTHGRLFSYTI